MRRVVAYVQLVLSLAALLVVVVLALLHPRGHGAPVVLVGILCLCSAALSLVKLRYLRDERLRAGPDRP